MGAERLAATINATNIQIFATLCSGSPRYITVMSLRPAFGHHQLSMMRAPLVHLFQRQQADGWQSVFHHHARQRPDRCCKNHLRSSKPRFVGYSIRKYAIIKATFGQLDWRIANISDTRPSPQLFNRSTHRFLAMLVTADFYGCRMRGERPSAYGYVLLAFGNDYHMRQYYAPPNHCAFRAVVKHR